MSIEEDVIEQIDAAFSALGATATLLSAKAGVGKIYEAWVLSYILKRLAFREGFEFHLINGSNLILRSSPGPISSSYAAFRGISPEREIEVWTDIEFTPMSTHLSPKTVTPPADRHELDIVVVPAGTKGRPLYSEVLWGVECKNSTFEKHMARSMLGVRRELSLLAQPTGTAFSTWPVASIPADPPSVLTLYSTDPKVAAYRQAGDVYGVRFQHLPIA